MSIKGSFTDPFTGYQLGSEHMMATANAHLLTNQPDNKKSANVGGWAGDVPGVASSFGFDDLIEDADGYLLVRAVFGGKNIVDAVKDHYNGSGA
ncbi:hypothetical protein ACWCRD_32440 [Streptomyces sp. NPDC002092]